MMGFSRLEAELDVKGVTPSCLSACRETVFEFFLNHKDINKKKRHSGKVFPPLPHE